MSALGGFENPILNSPYEPPAEHFVLGPSGPTGEVKIGRRLSESFIPVPVGRRRGQSVRVDEEAWASLYRTESRPFPKPTTGKLAVKVINDYGDEVVKVFEM